MADIRVAFTREDRARVGDFVASIKALKPNRRRAALTDAEREGNEIAGKLAEVAFGRYFGWPVDWALYLGGDAHVDFTLGEGVTVDTKAVWVHANRDYDFCLPVGQDEVAASFFVQVLVARDFDYGLITGGISQRKLRAVAVLGTDWADRGAVVPLVVRRSQLSRAFPPAFWGVTPTGGRVLRGVTAGAA